ncbi:hypothetical protein II906_05930 [bacterium]|nr:hypothetical protein [bacterium]
MSSLKDELKKYLLIKHAQNKLEQCNKQITKNIPWIQRKNFLDTVNSHCYVVLNNLLQEGEQQHLRRNEFIIDAILNSIVERCETILKFSKKTKDIKTFMQLNSFIVYDEIIKGLNANKNKKTIKFNINKELSQIQERMYSQDSIEDILQEKIGA